MTTRRQATAAVLEAQARFRSSMSLLPKWTRRAIARATRELAHVMIPIDVTHGLALEELADLVDVSVAPPAMVSRPPDREGDEDLLEARGRMRSGWRSA